MRKNFRRALDWTLKKYLIDNNNKSFLRTSKDWVLFLQGDSKANVMPVRRKQRKVRQWIRRLSCFSINSYACLPTRKKFIINSSSSNVTTLSVTLSVTSTLCMTINRINLNFSLFCFVNGLWWSNRLMTLHSECQWTIEILWGIR